MSQIESRLTLYDLKCLLSPLKGIIIDFCKKTSDPCKGWGQGFEGRKGNFYILQ